MGVFNWDTLELGIKECVMGTQQIIKSSLM